jgi:lambda family phage tail tape measure protein
MATAGSIVIDLLMKTGSFETDTKRAAKNLQDLNKQAQIAGAAIGTAFVAGTAAIAFFVKQSIDTMDAMSKLAQQTGTTVESISALSYAASLSDVSQDQLGDAISRLTKNMSDAARGTGEARAGFAALGLSVTDANGNLKSSDTVLSEIADKFAGYRDGAEKTALAVNIFGRAGAQLIPLLNSGADGIAELEAEAKRLGITLDTQTAQAAEAFNDSLTKLNATWEGFRNRVAAAALPALNGFTQALIEATTESDGLGESTGKIVNESGLKSWVDAVAVGLARVADVAVATAKTVDAVGGSFRSVAADVQAFLALVGKDNSGLAAMVDPAAAKKNADEYAAVLAYRNKTVEDANKAYVDLWTGQGNRFEQAVLNGINAPATDAGTLPAVKTSAPAIAPTSKGKQQIDEGQKLIDQLQKQVDLTGELTERQKLQIQIQQGYVKFQTQDQQDSALALADTLDLIRQQGQEYEAAQKRAADLAKLLDDLYPDKSVSADYLKDLTQLTEALQAGAISASDYYDAVDRLDQKFADSSDSMSEFAVQAAHNIEDSLGDGLFDLLSGNFDDIGKSWANMILRMIANAEAAQLGKALFGEEFDKSGNIGGLIGKGIAAIFGGGGSGPTADQLAASTQGVNAALPLAFADGGYTGPGGKFEPAGVVHAGEYVINATATRKLGLGFLNRLNGYADGGYVGNPPAATGGPNVQVNVVNQSSSNVEATQSDARFDGERYIINVLLKDKQKNGPVSRAFSGGR